VTELPAVLAGDAVCKTKNERKASESSQTKKTIMQKKKKIPNARSGYWQMNVCKLQTGTNTTAFRVQYPQNQISLCKKRVCDSGSVK
jgi:hypothetical protein